MRQALCRTLFLLIVGIWGPHLSHIQAQAQDQGGRGSEAGKERDDKATKKSKEHEKTTKEEGSKVNAAEGGKASKPPPTRKPSTEPSPESDPLPDEDEGHGPPMPSPEHSEDLLPPIAQGQPGFIPDVLPEELLQQAGEGSQAEPFVTLIGPPLLPTQSAEELITRYERDPALNLEPNFARIVVPRGNIRGSTDTKQFKIDGGLKVYYQDTTISADQADIDEKSEMAVLRSNVIISDPQYTLTTDELRVFFGDKRFEALGFVQFKKLAKAGKDQPDFSLEKKERLREYFAGQQFELFCNKLFYDWESKEMVASEGIRLVHPSFTGTMEQLQYNDKSKTYEMSGALVLDITDYEWVFSNRLAEDKDERRIRSVTNTPTKVSCDRLTYSEESGVASFYANTSSQVRFDQGARLITASFMEVNDKTKDFLAEGDASMPAKYEQTDGSWLYEAGLITREDTAADLSKALEGSLTTESHSIVYNFDRKRLEMSGGVKISSADKVVTANELIQDETAKFFLLHGNVKVLPEEGTEIYAAQIYADTENDIFTFVGLVQGKLKSEDADILAAESPEPGGAGGVSGTPATPPAQGLFRQVSKRDGSNANTKQDKPEANVAEGKR